MRWLVLGLVALATGAVLTDVDASGDLARGEDIYRANCAMCHGPDATGGRGAPALTGVVDRLSTEGVEVTVRHGRRTNPPMPAFGDRLDDTDITDLLTYLASLPDGPRNLPVGPEGEGGGGGPWMGGHGGGWMMGDRSGLWMVIVLLAAALGGAVGYGVARRRARG